LFLIAQLTVSGMNEHEDSGNSGGGPDEEEEWTDMRSQEVDEAVDADMGTRCRFLLLSL